jgi:hypothetical protein
MRSLPFFGLFLLIVCGPGCSSTPRHLVLAPIGPPPGLSLETSSPGSLQVFSALDPSPDFNASPYRYRHTDYQVYSADGTNLVHTVCNDTGKAAGGPARVELPTGRYQVVARANGYGPVTVPVVIRAGQVTTLHLEGSHWWPRSSPIFEANPVRLPGGQIVGWPVLAFDAGKP